MSHLWENGKGRKKRRRREGGKKGIEKERMEGRRNEKKIKEEGIQGERKKGEKKKSSAGFKPVWLGLLVVLSVKREGVVGRIGFTFLPSWATLFSVVQPAVQFLMVLLLPSRPLVHQLCCP